MIGAKLSVKLPQALCAQRKAMKETITQLLVQKTAETSPGAFLINFKFDDASELFLDTRISPVRISEASEEASMMTMTSTPGDLIEMLHGRLDPIKSFMSGRIQIDGDMTIAMKLAALFRPS